MTFVKCPYCKEEFEVDETKYDLTYVGCPICCAFFRNYNKEKEAKSKGDVNGR